MVASADDQTEGTILQGSQGFAVQDQLPRLALHTGLLSFQAESILTLPLILHAMNRVRLPAGYSPEKRRSLATELVEQIEAEAAADRERTGIPALGPAAILAQHPHDSPARPKKSPAPRIHAASRAARREYYEFYGMFVAAFRDAAERLRAGDLGARFPAASRRRCLSCPGSRGEKPETTPQPSVIPPDRKRCVRSPCRWATGRGYSQGKPGVRKALPGSGGPGERPLRSPSASRTGEPRSLGCSRALCFSILLHSPGTYFWVRLSDPERPHVASRNAMGNKGGYPQTQAGPGSPTCSFASPLPVRTPKSRGTLGGGPQ
jgi:hypothetical protein